jgi:hypothetical protein
MQTKKIQVIPPKKSDAKKNKAEAEAKAKPDRKTTIRKKLNEFGDNDSL